MRVSIIAEIDSNGFFIDAFWIEIEKREKTLSQFSRYQWVWDGERNSKEFDEVWDDVWDSIQKNR